MLTPMAQQWLTQADAARRLGLSRAAVSLAVREGKLVTVPRLISTPRISLEALAAYRKMTAGWHRGERVGRPRGAKNLPRGKMT